MLIFKQNISLQVCSSAENRDSLLWRFFCWCLQFPLNIANTYLFLNILIKNMPFFICNAWEIDVCIEWEGDVKKEAKLPSKYGC